VVSGRNEEEIMSATSAEVVSPAPTNADELAKVLSFIEAHEARHSTSPEPAFFLSGAGEHDRVELNEQLHAILKRVVQALSHGQSISILTRDQEISTQQAAEILGLSRPTVVKLIDEGGLSAHVPGAVRRKLRLADVLAYREELRERRNQFITESSAEYDDADADEVAELLAEARRRK
jgi:excisionase family DNA binding protein